MLAVSSLTHPCDEPVPIAPTRLSRPWIAICPGPPSNSCNTSERALRASANGPPASPAGIWTVSSTKNWPEGVGVDGFPTTAAKVLTTRPRLYARTRRVARLTNMCQVVFASMVPACSIQPVDPFGRPGSMTWSHRVPLGPVARPTTGSVVRSPVMGRRPEMLAACGDPDRGARRAVWLLSRIASCWLLHPGIVLRAASAGTAAAQNPASTSNTSTTSGRCQEDVARFGEMSLFIRDQVGQIWVSPDPPSPLSR